MKWRIIFNVYFNYLALQTHHIILIVIGFINIQLITSANKTCSVEYSFVSSYNISVKWETNSTVENEIVISHPPCIDKNNQLITRICENGQWNPSSLPHCNSISTNNADCPDSFEYAEGHCVYLTENQNGNEIDHSTSITLRNTLRNQSYQEQKFWLPVKRIIPYGPFEYIGVGDNYGKIISLYFNDYKQFFSGDCLVFNNKSKSIQPEACKNSYPKIRKIPENYQLYFCPENCQDAGLALYKCYCKRYNTPCEEFAKITSFYDKNKLRQLAGDDECEVDVGANPSSTIKSSINTHGWRTINSEMNCSICSVNAQGIQDADMVMSFEEKKSRLYLIIYFHRRIFEDNSKNKYAVYCFTDASKYLKKKVDIKIEWKSNRNLPYSVIVYKIELEKYIGQYWCEALTMNNIISKTNKIIAYKKQTGNEFVIRLLLKHVCKYYSCNKNNYYDNFIDAKLYDIGKIGDNSVREIRVMKIFQFDVDNDTLDFLLHISMKNKMDVITEFYIYLSRLQQLPYHIEVIYFRSAEWCLPEITILNNFKITWPLTKINRNILPEEICLTENDLPITRICNGDFLYGASWSKLNNVCLKNVSMSHHTQFFKQSLKQNFSIETIAKAVNETQDLTVLDVYYLSQILNQIQFNNTNFITHVLEIIDKLLNTDDKILEQSEQLLQVTDETLFGIEELLLNLNYSQQLNSTLLIQKSNIILHVTNPFVTNISGFILQKINNSLSVIHLPRNCTFDNIKIDELQFAVCIPESVLQQIEIDNTSNINEIFIETLIFKNSKFFLDYDYKTVSFVVNIDIPGYGSYLQDPISILLRSQSTQVQNCSFWDNGKKTLRKKGQWSNLGTNYQGNFNETELHLCSFMHLTNFALLVMSDKHLVPEQSSVAENTNEEYLFIFDIITALGSSLSLFGIFGIFLTAIIFEKWRRAAGTKILLNLSIAILLEILCIHLSEIRSLRDTEDSCKIIGMLLHYVVLSKFSWMLVYGVLQYFRFVKVMGGTPNNLLLKSLLIGWIIPLIIVLLTGILTSQSYYSNDYEFCYPRESLLYLTVLLPIGLIISINLIIFCIIMYEITHTKIQSSATGQSHKLQIYLFILLFFVLGIPWFFGILAEIVHFSTFKIVLFYIFCITSTLQGFILFLFYIVLNIETRKYWYNYIKKKIVI